MMHQYMRVTTAQAKLLPILALQVNLWQTIGDVVKMTPSAIFDQHDAV
jgi:hypothetical protein